MTAKPSQRGNDDSEVLKFEDFQGPLTSNSKTLKTLFHFQGLSRSWKNGIIFSRTFKAVWPPWVIFPAALHHCRFTVIKLYCTVTQHTCKQLTHSRSMIPHHKPNTITINQHVTHIHYVNKTHASTFHLWVILCQFNKRLQHNHLRI